MKFDKPLISIVVPIYNSATYLEYCIESLSNQTYENLEIILVNDGSTDGSLDICNRYKILDERIIIIDQKNEGVSSARNNGINVAKGEFIGFVDSDDFIDKRMYEELFDKINLEKSQCAALINFTVKARSSECIELRSPISSHKAIEKLFLLQFPTSMCAYLYKAEIVKQTLVNTEIQFFEDFYFNYNILKKCNSISIHEGEFYHYRENLQGANHQKISNKVVSCLKIHKKIENDIISDKNLYDKSLFFHAHCIISMILKLSISNPIKKSAVLNIVLSEANSYKSKFINAKYVPYKYSLIIALFSISPTKAIMIINLLRKPVNNIRNRKSNQNMKTKVNVNY